MPLTVNEIFTRVGLKPSRVPWNSAIPTNENGVYVVSLSPFPNRNTNLKSRCRIEDAVFAEWRKLAPKLSVNDSGIKKEIEKELNRHWKMDESILYVGETSSKTNGLAKRIGQFYIHKVGWKGPHTGGYWIKLLSKINHLHVYYAACPRPRQTEFKMLMYFIEQNAGKTFYDIDDLSLNLPFANLKVDFYKKHLIKNAVKKKQKKI